VRGFTLQKKASQAKVREALSFCARGRLLLRRFQYRRPGIAPVRMPMLRLGRFFSVSIIRVTVRLERHLARVDFRRYSIDPRRRRQPLVACSRSKRKSVVVSVRLQLVYRAALSSPANSSSIWAAASNSPEAVRLLRWGLNRLFEPLHALFKSRASK
jgi:hypothetical protein